MQLTERELATVLAALRYWQEEMWPGDGRTCYPEHFHDVTPLTAEEIDELSERLNGGTL